MHTPHLQERSYCAAGNQLVARARWALDSELDAVAKFHLVPRFIRRVNDTVLGPLQLAAMYLPLLQEQRWREEGGGAVVRRWTVEDLGCGAGSKEVLDLLLRTGLANLAGLEELRVRECSMDGRTMPLVAAALGQHSKLSVLQVSCDRAAVLPVCQPAPWPDAGPGRCTACCHSHACCQAGMYEGQQQGRPRPGSTACCDTHPPSLPPLLQLSHCQLGGEEVDAALGQVLAGGCRARHLALAHCTLKGSRQHAVGGGPAAADAVAAAADGPGSAGAGPSPREVVINMPTGTAGCVRPGSSFGCHMFAALRHSSWLERLELQAMPLGAAAVRQMAAALRDSSCPVRHLHVCLAGGRLLLLATCCMS